MARDNPNKIRVVGLGTQDSFEEAIDFRDDYGTTSFQMLYDETFESWAAFGIRGQPAAILFDSDGVASFLWQGPFSNDEVLASAAELA